MERDLHKLHAGLSMMVMALTLPRMMAQRLFLLPGDPLPQAITQLTGLTQQEITRLGRELEEPVSLSDIINAEPTAVYYLVQVGLLASESPLGVGLRGELNEESRANLPLLEQLAEGMLPLLAERLPDPTAAEATVEALRQLFAAEQYSLPTAWLPRPPATPEADPDDIWMTMQPTAPELNLFVMALRLTAAARFGVPHRLGQALSTVPGLGTDRQLGVLTERLRQAPPDAPFDINGPDLVRLYLALHALVLLTVAELQPELMARLESRTGAPAPWFDPEQQQDFVAWISVRVQVLSEIFDEHFADEPAYQAAQAEVQRLAELL